MNMKTILTAGLLAIAFLPTAQATVPLPLSFQMGSKEKLEIGRPIGITVRIESAADFPLAEFLVCPSKDWSIPDGPMPFTGPVRAGQPIEFQFRAIALQENPEALRGVVRVAGMDVEGGIEAQWLQGEKRERMRAELVETPESIGGKPTRERGANVTVTGRFVFVFDGVQLPIRKAKVELWNAKADEDLLENKCATSSTDGDGNFSFSASGCSDLFSDPDLQVRLILDNDVVQVRPDALFASSYSAVSEIKKNRGNGTYGFGTMQITDATAMKPFRLHNLITRAYEAMKSAGVELSKVTVVYPSNMGHNQYIGFSQIHLVEKAPFEHEAGIFHEYGHHFLSTKAESPISNYAEGGDWHPNIWAPELGVISWTEGFPDFFASIVYRRHKTEDKLGASAKYGNFEKHGEITAPVSEWDRIEGVIAATLWDIIDTEDDDERETGPGQRDNLSMKFEDILDVIQNYDPEPFNPFHNHPTSIHELFDGFREMFPNEINRVAEVYREHGLTKPLPDLRVVSFGTVAATVRRGQILSIPTTVANRGSIFANSAFNVQWRLGAGALTTQGTIPANFGANAASSITGRLTIPLTMVLGEYTLRACVDSGSDVPETDEGNNCMSGPTVRVIP